MHRDEVEVEIEDSPRGPLGRVIAVRSRGLREIAGTLRRQGGSTWLDPEDPRLPERLAVRGRLPRGVSAGRAVIAERIDGPADQEPVFEVVEDLGPAGSAWVEIEKTLLREGIEEDFPEAVEAELSELPRDVRPRDLDDREDLRDLPFLTIDPPDARDHDDAVWARARRDGGWELIVAIADVSHYVPEGSELDVEALERGCTHYLPDRVVPMLPLAISADLASLVPGRDRLAMVVHAVVDDRGTVREAWFDEAVIRSRARLSYADAARALGMLKGGRVPDEARRQRGVLKDLFELSQALRDRQARRGALFLETPAREVRLDRRGEPVDVVVEQTPAGLKQAYGMIEQLMLLANEVVAEELDHRDVATLFRVHEQPDRDRLREIEPLARQLGVPLPEGDDPAELNAWLREVDERGLADTLHPQLLRLLRPAAYEVDNVGHFGLAKDHYLHFTSPIRRYPDLVVHRLVRAIVRREPKRRLGERMRGLEGIARRARRRERQAAMLAREAQGIYAAVLMEGSEGRRFAATVTRLESDAVGLTLDRPAVEVRMPRERLPDDRWALDETGTRLQGSHPDNVFELGERLDVRIVEVSLRRREIVVEE